MVAVNEIEQDQKIFHREDLHLPESLQGVDICSGADPYTFSDNGAWHMVLQSEVQNNGIYQTGLRDYVVRSAPLIKLLPYAQPERLLVDKEGEVNSEVWAAEMHRFNQEFGDNPEYKGLFTYVAKSDGNNENHRMYVYRSSGGVIGPWEEKSELIVPLEDNSWAIDLTVAKINGKTYEAHSGWEGPQDQFPQHIYMAELESPYKTGKRVKIASPTDDMIYCDPEDPRKKLIEAPQRLMIDNIFRGFTVSAGPSWKAGNPEGGGYNTYILKYLGGDIMNPESWRMACKPLFPNGHGIGHGSIEQEGEELMFIGHRKTSKNEGWTDRAAFMCSISREDLENYLAAI